MTPRKPRRRPKWNAQIVVAEIQARQRKGLPYARWSDVARDDYALAIAANRCIGHWPKVLESVEVGGSKDF